MTLADWELIRTEQRDHFTIELYVTPESIALEDTMDETVSDFQEMYRKIENGTAVWFMAKVVAKFGELELGETYLGGIYEETYADFYQKNADYYEDMVFDSIDQARKKLKEIQLRLITLDLD